MSTIEDSQQHQIKDLVSTEENIPTSREIASLLGNERQNIRTRMRSNFHCRCQRCYVSSKAALLILLWNLILVAGFKSLLDPNLFRVTLILKPSMILTHIVNDRCHYVFRCGISFPLLPFGCMSG